MCHHPPTFSTKPYASGLHISIRMHAMRAGASTALPTLALPMMRVCVCVIAACFATSHTIYICCAVDAPL